MVYDESKNKRFSISRVLKLLNLSRSGYYDYLNRGPSEQKIRKDRVKKEIMKTYEESHQNYGAPKITKVLQKQGETISERTVGTYMKEMGIQAQWVKKSTRTTIDSDFSCRLRNILKQNFSPDSPNAVWCSDITYIWTENEGFVYLTSIMDLYSRRIIAWNLTKTMEVSAVLECIEEAKKKRKIIRPLIIHTDRGVHFTSRMYKEITAGMKRSYSKKAYPWDNACIESFHSLLKREWLNRFKIVNYRHAFRLCKQYIDEFYNSKRIHSHCDYETPRDWEMEWEKRNRMRPAL